MLASTMFSGIGAPEAAMPGWDWAWAAENSPFSSAVLAARHPQSVNIGDVTVHDFIERAAAIARPDVLVFGSPCQSFSVAGRRLGMDDPRGNLALAALRVVGRLRPRWFVFENVPGLLSSAGGSDFGFFLRQVGRVGYFGAWAVLDAQWFGVAQRRKRLFFVGHLGDWRCPAAVLLEPESVCGNHPPRREARERIAPTIASRTTGGGGLGTDFDCDGGSVQQTYRLFTANNDVIEAAKAVSVAATLNGSCDRIGNTGTQLVARALTVHPARIDGETETFVTHALRADGFDASEDGTGRGTPIVPVAFSAKDSGGDAQIDPAPTLRAGTHDRSHANAGVMPAVAFTASEQSNSYAWERDIYPTLDGQIPNDTSNLQKGVRQGAAVRRLTPRECERLQGFPDDYTLIEYRGKPAADGPRYKALGNSMCVNVMRWILSRIEVVDRA